MHKHLALKLLILIMFSWVSKAQGQNITIKGKIVDIETSEAIPFAHLLVENTGIGTISDLYDNFIFSYPKQYKDARLEISCLGYKPVKISLHQLNQEATEIKLKADIVELSEVVVKPENPMELIREAFRRIPENYDTTANVLSGYYKMSASLGDKNIRYTEALIDIFKLPYQVSGKNNKPGSDSIRLREVRIKPNEIEDWKLHAMLPWERSIYHLENRDIIKEFVSEKNAFERFMRNYQFELEKLVMINGRSLIRFNVVDPTDRIQVDLYSGMSVDSIMYHGNALSFEWEFNAIYVDFPEILRKDAVEEIKVYFSGRPVDFNPEIPLYGSFLWVEDLNGNPWLQAICQGYGASGWWPNKDHLSDEPDSAAISVTVPGDLEVVANGRLSNKTPLDNGKTRFDWFVSYPINNYNITLNAGEYTHFEDKHVNGKDTLDLDYYVLSYNLENARKKIEIVKPMLATYEKFFGAYPFPRDGFKLVETPHAMEH